MFISVKEGMLCIITADVTRCSLTFVLKVVIPFSVFGLDYSPLVSSKQVHTASNVLLPNSFRVSGLICITVCSLHVYMVFLWVHYEPGGEFQGYCKMTLHERCYIVS